MLNRKQEVITLFHSDHNHSLRDEVIRYDRAFAFSVVLNAGFVVVEGVFGALANSMALLADAGHNFSDVLALMLAWGASVLAGRQTGERYTYGLRKSTILAALINAVLLLLAVGAIAWESTRRLSAPAPAAGMTMLVVAAAGAIINAATAMLFRPGSDRDLNIRGAYLHMAGDAAVSIGVAVAGVAIVFTGWQWLDPTASLLIVAIIAYGAWRLLNDSVNLAMDAVPEHINIQEVQTFLRSLPNIASVHDVHIWAMSTTETALTAHLVLSNSVSDNRLLAKAEQELKRRFDIGHVTLQLELDDDEHQCALAPE